MENVDTSKLFADLGLTRGEEQVLRHIAGLRVTAPRGCLERIFYGPLKPLDYLVALLVIIAILLAGYFYVGVRFWEFVQSIGSSVVVVALSVVVLKRDRLIRKLYRALENERGRAHAGTGAAAFP